MSSTRALCGLWCIGFAVASFFGVDARAECTYPSVKVADGCAGIPTELSCCSGSKVLLCNAANETCEIDCATYAPTMLGDKCGWSSANGVYTCSKAEGVDPSGTYPRLCGDCTPDCTDKACGGDGCGGSCGECTSPAECVDGQCVCTPDCAGRNCGDDGCGGSCGDCGQGETCLSDAYSAICCSPDCTDKACGDDGCGGSCGDCECGDTCTEGHCVFTACDGRECGSDGCGGSCGDCDEALTCDPAGSCRQSCAQGGVPEEKACCDGTVLRGCYDGFVMSFDCAEVGEMVGFGPLCGWVEVDNGTGYSCSDAAAVDPSGVYPRECGACMPACDDRDCGADGCGGSCGECVDGSECVDGLCAIMIPDVVESTADVQDEDTAVGEDILVVADVTVGEDTVMASDAVAGDVARPDVGTDTPIADTASTDIRQDASTGRDESGGGDSGGCSSGRTGSGLLPLIVLAGLCFVVALRRRQVG